MRARMWLKPLRCPMCGAVLDDVATYTNEERLSDIVVGFDCYCGNCGWSGDIEPDGLEWEKALHILKEAKSMKRKRSKNEEVQV